MKKFLILLALIATPAYAESDHIAKARADLEATRAINRANEAKIIANNQAIIDRINKELDETGRAPRYMIRRYYSPSMSYLRYRADLRIANMPRPVCVNGKCY